MDGKLEVGGMALTLIDLPPVMAGSVVELLERLTEGDIVDTPSGPHVALGNGWICAHELAPLNAAYADKSLMPLRGDFQPERQLSKEVPA
ncbi:hypothetical protein [uncultured Pseudomonas sp.]|uniref:hypothetical protein n=1 Tax=uncultured Pseudomonas sp. TaxID=114707 RepID=UPI0030D7D482